MLLITLFAFTSVQVWTVKDIRDFYRDNYTDGSPKTLSPLYYQGSDDKFHYLICSSKGEWMNMQVESSELRLDDIRSYSVSTTTDTPGYYAIDPMDNFQEDSIAVLLNYIHWHEAWLRANFLYHMYGKQ